MNIRPIHTKADYRTVLKKVSALVDADPKRGTPQADELEVLGTLVQAYEAQHYPLTPSAGAYKSKSAKAQRKRCREFRNAQ